MSLPVLWQFRFSHFNEKVRWALDLKQVAHQRYSLLPGLHIPPVLLKTGQKQVPVLVVDGRVITDSTRILAYLEETHPNPALYPSDPAARQRALELEEYFDEELGPEIRRAFFHLVLPHTAYIADQMSVGQTPALRTLYRFLFPGIRVAMRMDMRIDESGARRGQEKTLAVLDRITNELQPSGYLVGDAFSVADLTAASLLAPALAAPEFSYEQLPMPAEAEEWRASLAKHPSFQWALGVYRRHRGKSAEVPA